MIRLAVRCAPAEAERVLTELLELVPGGVEEDHGDGYVEYAIYGPAGELPDLPDLEAASGAGLVEITATEIPDDWTDRWRDFHNPLLVAGRLWVRPPWADPARAPLIDVIVEPGNAFGTGAHPTTRMCIELLAALADEGLAGGPLCDLGTGSGVLAIAAARLGWGPVSGCDHERAALDAAAANASLNGVELALERINLRTDPAPAAPTLVANLTARLLTEVAARLAEPPRALVCSGVLASEATGVAAAFAARGLAERERRRDGDWVAFRFER